MTQKFARGKKAYGFSERTGFRVPVNKLVRDGQTGILVEPEEYDPYHPQAIPLGPVSDAVSLYRPVPDSVIPQLTINLPGSTDAPEFASGDRLSGILSITKPEVV